MPPPVYALVLSVFSLGTAESVIAGLLPQLSGDLQVSLPAAGLLVTAYAGTVVVAGPLITLLTGRLPRRALLLGLLALFALGNAMAATAPDYPLLLAARIVSALSHCTVFALALGYAADTAGPDRAGAAVARIVIGVNLATIVGVPLGLTIAQHWGWRATFWSVAALTLVALGCAARTLPAGTPPARGALAELRILALPQVRAALLLTVLGTVGGYAAFTFLTPLLRRTSHYSPGTVTLLLFVFGLGSLAGGIWGGRLADRALLPSLCALLTGLAATLLLLGLTAPFPAAAAVLTVLFSVLFFALNPGLGARVLGAVSDRTPTVAVAVSVAAVQTAIALGAWLGGRVLDAGAGLRAVPVLAAALTLLGALACRRELRRDRRARASVRPPHPVPSPQPIDLPIHGRES